MLLEGIRVLDFSSNVAGPSSAAIFADYGAEVVKVERPKTGNDERAFGIQVEGVSLLGAWLNRGKKSITLDLKDPQAIEIIKKMIPDFHILIESGRPGVMDKLGLGYEALSAVNPKLVYCSISAFGQEGPYAKKPGYDILAQAMSGVMHITGESDGPPMKSGTTISDYVSGLNAFACSIAALRYAEMTGIGQYVDVSLLMSTLYLNGAVEYLNVGLDIGRSGNYHNVLSPYGLYQGKNGQSIIIAVISPKLWATFCEVMGRKDLLDNPKFTSQNERRENRVELNQIIEAWLATFDDIQDAANLLDAAKVPACKVLDNHGVVNDIHIKEQQFLTNIETPDNVTSKEQYFGRNCIARFSKTPGKVNKGPVVGENNYDVLEAYGYSTEEIQALLEKWGQ